MGILFFSFFFPSSFLITACTGRLVQMQDLKDVTQIILFDIIIILLFTLALQIVFIVCCISIDKEINPRPLANCQINRNHCTQAKDSLVLLVAICTLAFTKQIWQDEWSHSCADVTWGSDILRSGQGCTRIPQVSLGPHSFRLLKHS